MLSIRVRVLLGLVLVLAVIGLAQERPGSKPSSKVYLASEVVLVSGYVADISSSWGKLEMNPVARGEDGRLRGKGAGMAMGVMVGVMVMNRIAVRKWPKARKLLRKVNFAAGGLHWGMAVRNWGIPR